MALLIAGERSGVGKTTVTLALLAALQRWQLSVQSFKVGPDYIDPMFHQAVTGRPCRNLDPVLTSEAYIQQCFSNHSRKVDYALVEGVMGLFDGASGADDWASTAHIARLLNLPILLVLDCSRLSRSVAAVAHGYRSFDPQLQIAGLVLNRVGSERHLDLLKTALAPLNLPILGILHRHDAITIPDRHLGLVPTAELPELQHLIDQLASLGQQSFNWPHLLPLLTTASSPTPYPPPPIPHPPPPHPLRLAIAHDRAFSFYYPDNLDFLNQLGAELLFWSPLTDPDLPPGASGLYFGGGFPELFAAELSENWAAQQAVKAAILAGMPTYAECGGLMYLAESLIDFEGQNWKMVGVLPTTAVMGKRLTLGYRRALAQQDSPLMPIGTTVWGHEFHRSSLTLLPQPALYQIQGYDPASAVSQEGWCQYQLHASYVHLHWGGRPEIPARFLDYCARFAQTQP
ncbi:cobyrinate a,c-diamide synthase [Leptolyngbya sp. NK1-12]|uniref:Cobyrinate a,c-diamide synthase n=1 Tax=Leptolyngbya sp. NK1-12 TaxID=2547451 RepID=A0AA96WGL2_9CYAN|nr:cobyrinate a,c-diamide synthase [Leptolyngbya sp. NK1-12]WNZ24230.1 cobyrinate a,c-diamide synthase [Leptolyngbya sp. NK1-12]